MLYEIKIKKIKKTQYVRRLEINSFLKDNPQQEMQSLILKT